MQSRTNARAQVIPEHGNAGSKLRVRAAFVLVAAATLVLIVQHVARPAFADVRVASWILGWLPNFVTALAVPLVWVTLNIRFARPAWAPELGAEALATTVILLLHELMQLRDASHTFAVVDIMATLAGAACALPLYHALRGGPR